MDPISQTIRRPVSNRRRRGQRGIEAIEFGLFFVMMLAPFVWMFITGMNFVRYNKANDVVRAAALMYVKGQDLTLLGNQEIIERVAQGLDLEVDNQAAAPNQVISHTQGSGLIVISKVQYVGPNTCNNCTNTNYYVFAQRIYIGNTSLQFNGSTVASALGSPSTADWNSTTGAVSNMYTDTGARVASSFTNFWSPTLGDGQYVYVIEGFFAATFGSGQFGGNGIYARVFM